MANFFLFLAKNQYTKKMTTIVLTVLLFSYFELVWVFQGFSLDHLAQTVACREMGWLAEIKRGWANFSTIQNWHRRIWVLSSAVPIDTETPTKIHFFCDRPSVRAKKKSKKVISKWIHQKVFKNCFNFLPHSAKMIEDVTM